MQLAIVQAWEAGLLQTLWHWSPFLSVLCWLCLLLGAFGQFLLLRKAKKRGARWSFAAVLAVVLLAGELGCQLVTGLGLLAWILLYGLALRLLLGALLNALLWRLACLRK